MIQKRTPAIIDEDLMRRRAAGCPKPHCRRWRACRRSTGCLSRVPIPGDAESEVEAIRASLIERIRAFQEKWENRSAAVEPAPPPRRCQPSRRMRLRRRVSRRPGWTDEDYKQSAELKRMVEGLDRQARDEKEGVQRWPQLSGARDADGA